MRIPIIPALLILLINLLVDAYIYNVCRRRLRSTFRTRLQLWSSVALYAVLAVIAFMPFSGGNQSVVMTTMWLVYSYLSVYLAKYIYVIFDLLAKIPRIFGAHRWRGLSATGLVLAIVTFGLMWWGALINRFNIQRVETDVEIAGLPRAFEGYRIVQFSDLHTGTYGSDTTFVAKLVDEINALNPDVILFTGDIVNSTTDEVIPHTSPLSRLRAKDGVYAILGNHDYGDYARWPSEEIKQKSRRKLHDLIRGMGWRLLLNETEYLRQGGDSIALIGVENIGDPPFPVYGSLSKAYPHAGDSVTKILMSHNPAHWTDSISGNPTLNIPLTLSGHTHAMQMEMFGRSPAALRYRTWGGLYGDGDDRHQLYVNIGAGTVGFPARIGATPEITVITLRTKETDTK